MLKRRPLIKIKTCSSNSDYTEARKVTSDYIEWLGIDLSFQKIEDELTGFEKMYGPPKGLYLLAIDEEEKTAGGVGLREFAPDICEMKRLYVYPKYLGSGGALCIELIKQAKLLGYKKMRLDTMIRLKAANKLYDKLGFYEIAAYRDNPDESARFMELQL